MIRFGRYLGVALLIALFSSWTGVQAQGDCVNEALYPFAPTTPSADGAVTTISTCSFEQEYSVIIGIESGLNYDFTLSSGGYITIRQGTVNGPVLAQGYSPVFANAASDDSLFVHWNVDDQCALLDDCMVTTVQRLVCTPPSVIYTIQEDCDLQTYIILMDISSTGDAASLDIIVALDGDTTTLEGQGVGELPLGPFTQTQFPSVTLAHDSDTDCDRVLALDYQPSCPNLITCGAPAEQLEYCYGPNDTYAWLYESVGGGLLRLRFNRGTIAASVGDSLRIYDGSDATAPLLFEHTATTTYNLGPVDSNISNDLPYFYTIDVFATGGSLYMQQISDGFTQCGGEFPSTDFDGWEWEVVCLDCELPEVTYSVTDDCANDQFSIPVDVVSTGDGAALEISYTINGGTAQVVTGLGTGIAELGPFALNDTIGVTIVPEGSDLCIIELGDITDTGTCPLLLPCGVEVSDSTCYGNNDDLRYYYQGTGTFPLGLLFDAGQLFFGDSLIVYDGGTVDATVLFAGTDQNVTGLFLNTTNPEHRLAVRILANEFTSCQDGFEPEQLEWRVSCLDCVPATAAYSVVLDCPNSQYFVSVDITDLGSDTEAQIGNTLNTDTLLVTAAGAYQVGPFPAGSPVMVSVVNDANFLCNVQSPLLLNAVCPVDVPCPGAPLEQTLCYADYDTLAWSYQLAGSPGSSTLRLTFLQGSIEQSVYDKLRIYDGPSNTAPLLFEFSGSGIPFNLGPVGSATGTPDGAYLGVDVGSTTGTLYMEFTSDVSGSCEGGFNNYDSWVWEVYCIDCANPAATFNIVPDCPHRAYSTEVIVTEVGGDDLLNITDILTGESITGLGIGVHTFGPYPVDSASILRVFNESYPACRTTSDTLIYTAEECISVTCGFDNYEYCYENSEDRWYTYRSEQNVPMTIGFLQGQLLAGDRIEVYNGADESVLPALYTGNNGGNLTGFAINSQNVENTITLRIVSDATGSCEDGGVTTPLRWTVACGSVGLAELTTNDFSVYPNPTEGLLQIELGAKVTGAVQFRLLDMSGRVVLDQPLLMNGGTRNTLDLRGLQSGNYMVQLTTAKWVKTQRVQLAR